MSSDVIRHHYKYLVFQLDYYFDEYHQKLVTGKTWYIVKAWWKPHILAFCDR